jgi:hypothetical protein
VGHDVTGMHAELQQLPGSVLPRANGSCERAGRFDGQSGLGAPRPGPAEWDGGQRRAYLVGYHQGRAGWLGCRDSRAAGPAFGPPLHLDKPALAAAVGDGSDTAEAARVYLRAYAHFSGYQSTAEMLASHRLRFEIREVVSGVAHLRSITPDVGGDELLAGDCLRAVLTEARSRSLFSDSEWTVAAHGTGLEIARYLGGRSDVPQRGTGNVIVKEPAGATLVSDNSPEHAGDVRCKEHPDARILEERPPPGSGDTYLYCPWHSARHLGIVWGPQDVTVLGQ